MSFTFYFENGSNLVIKGETWGKVMGEALFQARTRGRITRYD